jgi:hypothetical protein
MKGTLGSESFLRAIKERLGIGDKGRKSGGRGERVELREGCQGTLQFPAASRRADLGIPPSSTPSLFIPIELFKGSPYTLQIKDFPIHIPLGKSFRLAPHTSHPWQSQQDDALPETYRWVNEGEIFNLKVSMKAQRLARSTLRAHRENSDAWRASGSRWIVLIPVSSR